MKPKFKVWDKVVHKLNEQYMIVYSVELFEWDYLYNWYYENVLKKATEKEILEFYL